MAFGRRPGRFTMALQRFMMGRYGTDKLNMLLLGIGVALTVVNLFFNQFWVNLTLPLLAYLLMGIALFRTFSRNTYKRYRENQRFLLFFQKLRDRQHRYYDCPRCRQQIRVPRGKGKISITCPKCRERFVRKS